MWRDSWTKMKENRIINVRVHCRHSKYFSWNVCLAGVCVCVCECVLGDDAKCVSWCGLQLNQNESPGQEWLWSLPHRSDLNTASLRPCPLPWPSRSGWWCHVCVHRVFCALLSKAKIECLPQRQVPRTENMTLTGCTTFRLSSGKNNVSPGFAVCIYFWVFTIILEQFLLLQAILLAPKAHHQGALAKITPRRSPVNFLYPVPLSIRQPGSLTISQFLFHGKKPFIPPVGGAFWSLYLTSDTLKSDSFLRQCLHEGTQKIRE